MHAAIVDLHYYNNAGQHKLALMQTRKEHLRLEKSLLQQQRDVRRLEQAYKTTTSGGVNNII